MLGVDTNILVRFFTRDDPAQFKAAQALVGQAGTDGLFLNAIVLAELYWVLHRTYKMPKNAVLGIIDGLLDTREFVVERRDIVIEAVGAAKETNGDFADALIALINQQFNCSSTTTFDVDALRIPQMKPVQENLA